MWRTQRRVRRGLRVVVFLAAVLVVLCRAAFAVASVPSNTVAPSVSGQTAQGASLSADVGGWSSDSALTYGYQWQRCGDYGAAVQADSPTGFWRLGEGSGSSAADSGSAGYDGTYTGGYTLGQTGPVGWGNGAATAFNGTSGYVQLGHTVQFDSGNFTIEGWFKAPALSSGFGSTYGLMIWSSGEVGGNQCPPVRGAAALAFASYWDFLRGQQQRASNG